MMLDLAPLLGVGLVCLPALLALAWLWATYGGRDLIAVLVILAFTVGSIVGGFVLIDSNHPPLTHPPRLGALLQP